jgi:hypothetical protein
VDVWLELDPGPGQCCGRGGAAGDLQRSLALPSGKGGGSSRGRPPEASPRIRRSRWSTVRAPSRSARASPLARARCGPGRAPPVRRLPRRARSVRRACPSRGTARFGASTDRERRARPTGRPIAGPAAARRRRAAAPVPGEGPRGSVRGRARLAVRQGPAGSTTSDRSSMRAARHSHRRGSFLRTNCWELPSARAGSSLPHPRCGSPAGGRTLQKTGRAGLGRCHPPRLTRRVPVLPVHRPAHRHRGPRRLERPARGPRRGRWTCPAPIDLDALRTDTASTTGSTGSSRRNGKPAVRRGGEDVSDWP